MRFVWKIAALAVTMTAFAVYAQQAGPIIRSASQLAGDPGVQRLSGPYRMVSAAHAIYDRCAVAYGLNDSYRHFITDYYDKTARAYRDSFTQAYIARFRASPTRELSEDFNLYLKTTQQEAMAAVLTNIEKHGCEYRSVRDILRFFDKLQREEAAKATPATPEPRSQP